MAAHDASTVGPIHRGRERDPRRREERLVSTGLIGYVRVSTSEQGDSGAGLKAQRDAITRECERRGCRLLHIEEDVQSGKSTRGRPGLARALASCEAGEAEGIVAAKLDRLTRSLLDFARLVEEANRRGYNLVVADQSFDLASPHGRAMAGMLAVFAEFERELISARTRAALKVKREQGIRLGRPASIPPPVAERIRAMRRDGASLWAICRALEADGVPTARDGAIWRPSSLTSLLRE